MVPEEQGVSTDAQKSTNSKDELKVLMGECREYSVGRSLDTRKVLHQRPLVLRHFTSLIELLFELMSTVVTVHPELLKTDDFENILSPSVLASFAHLSKESMEIVYSMVALLLNADKEFILDNMELPQFSQVLADAFELNDLKEVVKNFQRLGSQMKKQVQT